MDLARILFSKICEKINRMLCSFKELLRMGVINLILIIIKIRKNEKDANSVDSSWCVFNFRFSLCPGCR